MKRLLLLCSIATLAVGAAACTREKPSEPTSVAVQALTPQATNTLNPNGAATPNSETTPGASDTTEPTTQTTSSTVETPTVALPTSVPPATNTPAPVQPANTPGTYTVQRGDWMFAIARRFGISFQELLAANPGINPNTISPGLVLVIPSGASSGSNPTGSVSPSRYTVRNGDTLFSIGVRFHTTSYALQIANHLANPNFIYPGQSLIIPQ